MPRYFFNTADGGRHLDDDGIVLPNHAAARTEGIKFAGALLADQPDMLWDGRDFRVEVQNERRDLLFTIITLAVDAPTADG